MATQYQSETLSDQHTAADQKRTRARKGEKPQAESYKCRAQLLKQGRTNTHLGATENLWATLKVYASGGENGLHTHTNQDHTFLVLQGSARFYDENGKTTDVNKHEGIMLPAGAYYWFEATSKEELILFRIGCRTNDKDPGERININGDVMPGESAENKKGVIVYKDGEFFG
jgi:mannose-6-phosphate isomerase-like protein (cupin superfamily)